MVAIIQRGDGELIHGKQRKLSPPLVAKNFGQRFVRKPVPRIVGEERGHGSLNSKESKERVKRE